MARARRSGVRNSWGRLTLGPLETQIIEIIWAAKACTVIDIVRKLPENRPYTTIMSTADRMFYKGLLNRKKVKGRFIYRPRVSRQEFQEILDKDVVALFLSRPKASREFILSLLLPAVIHKSSGPLKSLQHGLGGSIPTVELDSVIDGKDYSVSRSAAILKVMSTPSGASIELNGSFVGDTPSVITVPAGEHTIAIMKQGYQVWKRTLTAYGGTIRIVVTLERILG